MASIMIEQTAIEDLVYSVAQAVILFGPVADSRHEYTSSEIAKSLNPAHISRRQPIVVYESDLEAGFSNSTIRNSLDKIFSLQLGFVRHTERQGQLKIHFFKIYFRDTRNFVGFTVESLSASIMLIIEETALKKRKKKIGRRTCRVRACARASPCTSAYAYTCRA